MKVWMDGELMDRDIAKVSVFDHGLLYGDGVFEGIRAYSGRIFQTSGHVDRLYASAKAVRMEIPYTKQELVDAIYKTLAANNLTDAYIRLVVSRGEGTLGLNPFLCPRPTVFIITGQITLYPKEMYEEGMAVIIAETRRTMAAMLPPSVKSCNYMNNILAKIEAIDAGVAEAIMLNHKGNIAECTGDNIFIVRDGTIVTPPVEAGILKGVTRTVAMRLAEKLAIPLAEEDFSPKELYAADECFLTGTAAEIIAVTKVNDKDIGTGKPGPVTKKLLDAFHKFVHTPEAEK